MYIKFFLICIGVVVLLSSCKKLTFLSPEGKETFSISEGTTSMTRDNPFYDEYGNPKSPPYDH